MKKWPFEQLKCKLHIYSSIRAFSLVDLQYLRIYVALVALMWHCLKFLIEKQLDIKVPRATCFLKILVGIS
jgi:hypothetical protein